MKSDVTLIFRYGEDDACEMTAVPASSIVSIDVWRTPEKATLYLATKQTVALSQPKHVQLVRDYLAGNVPLNAIYATAYAGAVPWQQAVDEASLKPFSRAELLTRLNDVWRDRHSVAQWRALRTVIALLLAYIDDAVVTTIVQRIAGKD